MSSSWEGASLVQIVEKIKSMLLEDMIGMQAMVEIVDIVYPGHLIERDPRAKQPFREVGSQPT
jgi:hypothetical protein